MMGVAVVFLVLFVRGVVRIWREQDARLTREPIKPKARAAVAHYHEPLQLEIINRRTRGEYRDGLHGEHPERLHWVVW